MTDRELLEQLARHRSEDAFNEIVRRHVDLVHSAAFRQLGNADTARDITQNVFILLAKQAKQLRPEVILTGWLYRTTRNLCLEHLRKDQRRREREQAAVEHLMNDSTDQWEHVAPQLEPAMDELNDAERHAVLLRFFKNKTLREVGNELGIGEDAAQKRVSRALDRLRDIFTKRGIALPATALAATISGSAIQATPAAILTTISTAALGAGLTAAVATATLNTTSTMTTLFNLKTAAAIIAAAAVTGTSTYLVKENEADRLRADYQAVTETNGRLATDQQQAESTIRLREVRIEQLKKDASDVHRLRGEVDRLNRALTDTDQLRVQNAALREKLALLAVEELPDSVEDDPGVSKPSFSVGQNVSLKKDEGLIAGGWETSPGRRTILFVRPTIPTSARDAILMESKIIEFPESALEKYQLTSLLTDPFPLGTDVHTERTLTTSLEVFDMIFADISSDPSVRIIGAPRVGNFSGQEGSMSVDGPEHSIEMRLLPELIDDGAGINLKFEADYHQRVASE